MSPQERRRPLIKIKPPEDFRSDGPVIVMTEKGVVPNGHEISVAEQHVVETAETLKMRVNELRTDAHRVGEGGIAKYPGLKAEEPIRKVRPIVVDEDGVAQDAGETHARASSLTGEIFTVDCPDGQGSVTVFYFRTSSNHRIALRQTAQIPSA